VNDLEKLRVLLAHWIEHNNEHAAEFRRWTERVRPAAPAAAGDVEAAAERMAQVNQALRTALDRLGGPVAPTGDAEHTHQSLHAHKGKKDGNH
jgi:hypothetical protein